MEVIRKENVKLTPELAWQNYLKRISKNKEKKEVPEKKIIKKVEDRNTIYERILLFLDNEIEDLQEEGSLCLEMCEEEMDFHMVSYWIQGTYDNVLYFIQNNYCDELLEMIMEMYPHNLETLKSKIERKYGECTNERIIYEGLSSILLNKMQYYPQWYSVYGSEEEDMIDFDKYNIIDAMKSEEFPVMKREDVIAAMFGINTSVQPSDMYDVFAHYADILKIKNKKNSSIFDYEEDGEDSTFTPDVFQSAGVVARYKNYQEFIKKPSSDIAYEFSKTMFIDDVKEKETRILELAIEDYKTRFSKPPEGLPIHNDMIKSKIVNLDGTRKYLISYNIRGVKDFNITWDHIADIAYDIPLNAKEYEGFIINMSIDFKRELNGLEKVRNKDINSVEGKYPNKYSATHGLTFIKDINTHYKDSRGNDCRKKPQLRYNLGMAEKQALYIIKKAFRYGTNNSIISCSFGIDSITTLHIARRVNKHNYKIIFNNSLVEYPQLIKYKNKMTEEWKLKEKLIETRPVETYWSILEKSGFNFQRKGDRNGKGANNSEECCNKIKHIPFKEKITMFEKAGNPMELDFSGLRALESRAREQQCKRDNLVYLAKTWKCIRVNPIAFFSDDMVWEYVEKYNIPYCEIYDMKVYYEDVYDNIREDEEGKIYYQPRIGCSTCMVNSSRGYLYFLRKYFKRLYEYMMYDKGLVVTLFERGGKKIGILSKKDKINTNQISLFDDLNEENKVEPLSNEDILNNYPLESMEEMIMRRPCKFLT